MAFNGDNVLGFVAITGGTAETARGYAMGYSGPKSDFASTAVGDTSFLEWARQRQVSKDDFIVLTFRTGAGTSSSPYVYDTELGKVVASGNGDRLSIGPATIVGAAAFPST